jgi:branched-chain amino acid transport system substrate-binding protein
MSEEKDQELRFRAPMSRRRFFALSGGGIAAALLAACGSSSSSSDATAMPDTSSATGGITGGGGGDGTIKIGYVTPTTGSLAAFAIADEFLFAGIKDLFKDGLRIGDKSYMIEILVEDSESDPNKAGEKAGKLITQDGIDIMLVGNTPETTNPVSDQCEANGVPCISSIAPWQPWFIGRGGKPGETQFDWTYHFFWGLEDIIPQFIAMWNSLDTNKSVGALFPNDGDGNVWGDTTVGFPPALTAAGYTLTDPGRYENLNQDFTAQINAFKAAKVEVVTGVVIPPDFPTFWKQAKQQGFVPKAVSIGKALLFPESIQALGKDGIGLTNEVWWSPSHPYKSSLTGISANELATSYTASSGRQWIQCLGFVHAMFEVAIASFVAAGGTDKTAVRDAIKAINMDTIVGPLNFTAGPVPNVAKTALCGGQWREADTPTGYDLVIVDNSLNPGVPTSGTIEPISA